LNSNETVHDKFTFAVTDSKGAFAFKMLDITVNGQNNIITGGAGNDMLFGGAGIDVIMGDAGNDTIDGKAGIDVMLGGKGNDIFVVDNPADSVVEFAGEGNDLVKSSVSFVLDDEIEKLTLTGLAAINGTGNSAANTITGNDAANTLDGGGGLD